MIGRALEHAEEVVVRARDDVTESGELAKVEKQMRWIYFEKWESEVNNFAIPHKYIFPLQKWYFKSADTSISNPNNQKHYHRHQELDWTLTPDIDVWVSFEA